MTVDVSGSAGLGTVRLANGTTISSPQPIPIVDLSPRQLDTHTHTGLPGDAPPIVLGGGVNVKNYGAKGDGVTDDTNAFIAALSTGMTVWVPYTATGYNLNTGNITVPTGSTLVGDNGVVLLSNASVLFNIVNVSQTQYTTISGFTINMSGSPAGSTAMLFKTSLHVIWRVRVSNVIFQNCCSAMQDEVTATNYVVDCLFDNLECQFTRDRQIYFRHSRGFLLFRGCRIDHTYNTTQVTWEGIRLEDFIGIEMERFDVVGPTIPTAIYQTNAVGIVINGKVPTGENSVWLSRVLVDSTRSSGILINNVNALNVNYIEAYANLGFGIYISNTSYADISNVFVSGGKTLTGSAASANGLTLDTCSYVNINNIYSTSNTGAGVNLFNTTLSNFSNISCSNNSTYGWVESGTCNYLLKNNANYTNNTTGNFIQVGASSAMVSYVPNSGVYAASTVGAATV